MLRSGVSLGIDARFVLQSHSNATRREQRRHGDLMILGTDSEQQIGRLGYLKVESFFRRALQVHRRESVSYLWYAKCDDDTYVVLPQLHRELELIGPDVIDGYYGVHCGDFVRDDDPVLRWYFCGAFYALTADVVTRLVRQPLGESADGKWRHSTGSLAWAIGFSEDVHMRAWLRSLGAGRNSWSCGFRHCHDAPGTGNLHYHQRPLSGETVFVHQVKHAELFARVAGYFGQHADAIRELAARREGQHPWATTLGQRPVEPERTLRDFFQPYCAW